MPFTKETAKLANQKSQDLRISRKLRLRELFLSPSNESIWKQIADNQALWEMYAEACIKIAQRNPAFLGRLLEYCSDRAYGKAVEPKLIEHRIPESEIKRIQDLAREMRAIHQSGEIIECEIIEETRVLPEASTSQEPQVVEDKHDTLDIR
jgi:hypothetical protein